MDAARRANRFRSVDFDVVVREKEMAEGTVKIGASGLLLMVGIVSVPGVGTGHFEGHRPFSLVGR